MYSPNVLLATKTLDAIEAAIHADQGGSFRENLGRVIPHMGDAFRGKDEGFRSHMGASLIGGECARSIWYGFNWAVKPKFKGQLLRLFNRGHLEEARFIACLLTIGVQVFQQDEKGNQFRISECGGHYGGSGDGVAIGIPDVPAGQPCLLEFKTHNDKSFAKLKAEGVRSAKFEHYVQMQQYMRKMGLACALYMAVNKNNDELYGEIVMLDIAVADQFLHRAIMLVPMREAPKRINESPGFYQCKWCDDYKVCHKKEAPERNCRTCAYSFPNTNDGQWYCNKPNLMTPCALPKEKQLVGCDNYTLSDAYCK